MAAAEHRIRVRYAESDQMGIAHHAAYVSWLEECRIELLRSLGTSYRDLEASGVLMPVVEIAVRYRRSLRFDDVAVFLTTAQAIGPSRVRFQTLIRHEGVACAQGDVTVAATDRAGRPMRVPAALLEALAAVGPDQAPIAPPRSG